MSNNVDFDSLKNKMIIQEGPSEKQTGLNNYPERPFLEHPLSLFLHRLQDPDINR